MLKNYNRVIVTGSIAYDEIMDFPSRFVNHFQPDKLHQINVSFVVDKLEKQLGGTGTNIAYNLSLLTKKKVLLLAGIGKDGKDFMKFYKKAGIETRGILVDKNLYTATGKVITDIDDNQIWGFYYGACAKGKDIPLTPYVGSDSLLIISANHKETFLHFQNEAIKNKVDYLYDPGMAMTWISDEDLKQGVKHCQILIGNDYEISYILKKIKTSIAQLLKSGMIIITTLGKEGVMYQEKSYEVRVRGYKVKKVVDPTGAGDAWRGGFIAGLLEGKEIKDCLIQANALASFAVEKYGTVNHKPGRKEIEKRARKLTI